LAWRAPAREEPVIRSTTSHPQPSRERISCRLGDLEWDRSAGLLLHDRRPQADRSAHGHVADPEFDQVTSPKLRVEGAIEHRKVADLSSVFNCWRIAQMCFGFSGALGPMRRPAFHGFWGERNKSGWRIASS
jgi:hypothetical protein